MTLADFRLLARLIATMFDPRCGAIVVTIFDKHTGRAETFGNHDAAALDITIAGQALVAQE